MTAQPKPTAADVDPPTVGHLRDLWVDWHLDPLPRSQGVALVPAYQAEFDRWLAEHDAQVAARAWDEGYDRGRYFPRRNPYRAARIAAGEGA